MALEDADFADKIRMLSSRAYLISSGDLIAWPIRIPFLKYSTISNAYAFHVYSIF